MAARTSPLDAPCICGRERSERRELCGSCRAILREHGMTRAEYDAIVAAGCSVPGCVRTRRTVIDHDHTICPQRNHSCNKCRRGPLCHYHNVYIIKLLDDLMAGKFENELAYLSMKINITQEAV